MLFHLHTLWFKVWCSLMYNECKQFSVFQYEQSKICEWHRIREAVFTVRQPVFIVTQTEMIMYSIPRAY